MIWQKRFTRIFFCKTNKNSISFHFCTHPLLLPAYITTYLRTGESVYRDPPWFWPCPKARIRLASFALKRWFLRGVPKQKRTEQTRRPFCLHVREIDHEMCCFTVAHYGKNSLTYLPKTQKLFEWLRKKLKNRFWRTPTRVVWVNQAYKF